MEKEKGMPYLRGADNDIFNSISQKNNYPERANIKNMTATSSTFNRENSRIMTTTLSTTNGMGRGNMYGSSPKNGGQFRHAVNRLTKFSDRSFDREVSQIFEGKSDEDFVIQESIKSITSEPDHNDCLDYESNFKKDPT